MDLLKLGDFTKGMTPEKWSLVPIELVEVQAVNLLSDALPVVDLIEAAKGAGPAEGDPFPHLVSVEHALWCEQGHCRLLVWRIRGCELMPMRVLRLE